MLHGVKNNSTLKRVCVGWHLKQYLCWEDILEYFDGKLYRENKQICKNDIETIVENIDVEKYQYNNTALKIPNPGMRFDTYVKVSKYYETIKYAEEYLQSKKPDLFIKAGKINENYYIHYGEISGSNLLDYVKMFNQRKMKNATLLIPDDILHQVSKALRDAFDRNLPYLHRDASMYNTIVTKHDPLNIEFIDFDSFIKLEDDKLALELFYHDMFHLVKHFTGWDNLKAKEICDVYFK